MNKDFDNNIPDFTARKKALKIILLLLIVSLVILTIQLFFKENLSFFLGNFVIINSFLAPILLLLYIALTADMYVTIKRIKEKEKEKEKVEVPNEFRIDGLKQNFLIVLYLIVLLAAITLVFASITMDGGIIMTLVGIFIAVITSIMIFRMYNNRKYALEINNKTIKILYKNQELHTIEKEYIALVGFFGNRGEKVKKGDYPVIQIFDLKGASIFTMPLALKDYWLLKKYFLKNDVSVEDYYNL